MAICYFNKDYERIYNCKYEKKNVDIEVTVEYVIINEIIIKLDGYIEIEMSRKVKYNEIYKYIYELMTYIQLLRPDKLKVNKITVCLDEVYYGFILPLKENKYKSSSIENSVSDDILVFLSKCYKLIPYRNSKSEI